MPADAATTGRAGSSSVLTNRRHRRFCKWRVARSVQRFRNAADRHCGHRTRKFA